MCAGIVISLFIGAPSITLAQFDASSLTAPQLQIELQPEHPQPGEEVTATLNDYSGGGYGANVTWVLDGEVIPNASNQRSVRVTAGAVGEVQTIQAILDTPNGRRQSLAASIAPLYLDIIIEPQTRVPEFYAGRALPSLGSMVNATALLSDETGFLDPDLVYTWRLERQVLEGGPIRGRNQVSFSVPMGKQLIFSVEVARPTGEVIARRAILLPSVRPTLHFYEVSSLLGQRTRALQDTLQISGNSATIQAEPYHLDIRTYNNPDIAEWEIDGTRTTTGGGNPYEVTLQRTGAGGGAEVEFHVRDTAQVLQGARGDLEVNY